MKTRIPNFNTLSTLIDRLSIENVKLSHFENAIEFDGLAPAEVEKLQGRVAVQNKLIAALKQELTAFMEEAFISGSYEYMKEERTFR
jgi:hypothetical protein